MAKANETWQLNCQRKISSAYIEVIRPEPSKAGIFLREHNLLSHCIYFNPLSVHRAAGQAWWSEISCVGDWYHQALTSFWFPSAVGSITLEMCPKYLFYPHQYKSTERGSAQPLGHRSHSGHCDSTISLSPPAPRQPLPRGTAWSKWPSPISDTGCIHWPHCVPAGGEHTPWADQQGKPPLSCRGLARRGSQGHSWISTMDRQLRPSKNIFQGICKPCQSEDHTQPTLLKFFLLKAVRTKTMTTLN